MTVEGFDYKEFAASMTEQAKELVPADLQDFEKEYIVKTLNNFTLLAGEALANDSSLKLNADQAVLVTQIIAEWSYHKSIDLVKSGILPQYWDTIMQKIAFTIFEIAKQAITRNIPQDQLLQAIEHHVVRVYQECVEDLHKKGFINDVIKERAKNQSNIDSMAQQAQVEQMMQQQQMAEESAKLAEERHKQKEKERAEKRLKRQQKTIEQSVSGITHKQLKLMSLALVLKILSQDKVTTILNKFDSNDSTVISQYMNMANLESQLDEDLVFDCIKQMKEFIPTKRKLTKENLIIAMREVYKKNKREKIEKIVKKERPLVKKYLTEVYDGEFGELPLRVAGIVTEYIEESV